MVDTLIQIDPRDILQADATIIAGILIMLTLSKFFFASSETSKRWGHPRDYVAYSPVMFGISLGFLLIGTLFPFLNVNNTILAGGYFFALGGIAYLLGTIILIVRHISSDKTHKQG